MVKNSQFQRTQQVPSLKYLFCLNNTPKLVFNVQLNETENQQTFHLMNDLKD